MTQADSRGTRTWLPLWRSGLKAEAKAEAKGGGKDASAEVKKQATAFSDYLTEKCGNPIDNIELPEMPEMPELPDSTE